VEVKLHNCALHGRCTQLKALPGVACCATCPDGPGTLPAGRGKDVHLIVPVRATLARKDDGQVELSVLAGGRTGTPTAWRIGGSESHSPAAPPAAPLPGGPHGGTLSIKDDRAHLAVHTPAGPVHYRGSRHSHGQLMLSLDHTATPPHLLAAAPPHLKLGSMPGSCPGITTDCCPSDPVPQTLNVVFTNATGSCTCFPPSTTLTWNGVAWTNPGIGGCGQAFDLTLGCTTPSDVWNLESNGLQSTANASSGTCSPFVQNFPAFPSNNSAVCTGQVDISITG
jgi:hypothetical protein